MRRIIRVRPSQTIYCMILALVLFAPQDSFSGSLPSARVTWEKSPGVEVYSIEVKNARDKIVLVDVENFKEK